VTFVDVFCCALCLLLPQCLKPHAILVWDVVAVTVDGHVIESFLASVESKPLIVICLGCKVIDFPIQTELHVASTNAERGFGILFKSEILAAAPTPARFFLRVFVASRVKADC
jgi:hypothetical protein